VSEVLRKLATQYEAADFFVARSPMLPFSDLSAWAEGCVPNGRADGGDYDACRSHLARRLAQSFSRPEVREALCFASPDLERRVAAWTEEPGFEGGFERVLTAYFTRLTSRETPFGLFAGVALGQIGGATRLEIAPLEKHTRHCRLGMGFLMRVLAELEGREWLKDKLQYEPNVTLQAAFARLRYASIDLVGGDQPSYPIVDVELTPHLAKALSRARGGAMLIEISSAISADGADVTEAFAFVRQLVAHGILQPCWRPAVTGPEPLEGVLNAIEKHVELRQDAARLRRAASFLASLERRPLGTTATDVVDLARELLPDGTASELAQLFQADLIKGSDMLSLSADEAKAFLDAAEVLQRTSPAFEDSRLTRFRERFETRYGAQFVPLAQALDSDLGIGFDGLEGLADDEWIESLVESRPRAAEDPKFTAYDEVRLEILTHCLRNGLTSCDLDDAWLSRFPLRPLTELPESFAISAHVAQLGGRAYIVSPTLLAPSAAAWVARFCHSGEQFEDAVRHLVDREQEAARPRVLADVAHFPNGHTANILLRPVLRAFEIPCGGKSGASSDRQISVSDLYVGVESGRVVLWSGRLNARVSIRVTNAHNTNRFANLPMYRFLGALQDADCGSLAPHWSWGALSRSAFLPRIVYRGVVLSRARWRLEPSDVQALSSTTSSELFALVQSVRQRIELPRWVSLVQQYTSLLIYLNNCICVDMMCEVV
jgi:hypothetical protein